MRMLIVLSAAAVFCGCGGTVSDGKSDYNGTVTWNGSPLPSGQIEFADVDGALDAAQITDGKFTIHSKPGVKTVSIKGEKKIGERTEERVPDPIPIMHQYLPKEFNEATQQSVELKGPEEPIVFDLTGTEVPAPKPDVRPAGRK
ncbi:MAG: hypothetical protein ACK5Q5_24830 [Planctomycetaceae bacterium]